jgi:hypothetical protein
MTFGWMATSAPFRYVQPLGFQLEIARILLWHPSTNGHIIAGLAESPRAIKRSTDDDGRYRSCHSTRWLDAWRRPQRIDDIWPVWTSSRSVAEALFRRLGGKRNVSHGASCSRRAIIR